MRAKGFACFAGFMGFSLFFVLFTVVFSTAGAVFAEPKAPAPEKRAPIVVTSDTMEASRNDRLVIFRGNVSAREDFLMCSDELYLRYNDANEIREIDARGGVRIFRDQDTSVSDRAVYDRISRVMVLTGNAEVVRCADTVKGDKITFYLDDDRAFVEGGEDGRVSAVIMPDKKCGEDAEGAAPPELKKRPEKGAVGKETLCTTPR
ncbi:MAG: hypothetical protein BMS9Abin23_0632 [Thermodesulfobacteriota bacterium]|nr:MAG: hypothetical protein BMS9Abin23_0632 [Thermodesulfobacteriota bacterium]